MRFGTLGEWLAWQEALHPKSIDLGLDRVKAVRRRMGRRDALPFTLTVAGTNGKGSSVAYLAAMLRAQGYRVGSYTSPHLLRYNERICIDGEPVSDDVICQAFARIDAVRGNTTLSFFEFGTLAALDIFAAEAVDLQVLEVGLGGRLDAVNIVDADVALLASIGMDHAEWLGATRDAIGLEKAGVMRRGNPAVLADADPPPSVVKYAQALGADLKLLGRDFVFSEATDGWNWHGQAQRFENLPYPVLGGRHQLQNASGALQVLELIAERWPVADQAIRRGLREVRLNGRFQIIGGDRPIVLDVAHNVPAAGILAGQLRECFPDRRARAVLALMRDKDVDGIVAQLKDGVAAWYLPPLRVARAAPPEALRDALRSSGVEKVECDFSHVGDAVTAACSAAPVGDPVVVFGSFFLVAEYLAQCGESRR